MENPISLPSQALTLFLFVGFFAAPHLWGEDTPCKSSREQPSSEHSVGSSCSRIADLEKALSEAQAEIQRLKQQLATVEGKISDLMNQPIYVPQGVRIAETRTEEPAKQRMGTAALARKAASEAPKAEAPSTIRLGDFEIEPYGYVRFRHTLEDNFDLDPGKNLDRSLAFYDLRSYLGLATTFKPFKFVISLDAVGNRFSDGLVLGNEIPLFLRTSNADIQEAYVLYTGGPVNFRAGRAAVGDYRGVISSIVRDSFFVFKDVNLRGLPSRFAFNFISGGKTLVSDPPGTRKPRPFRAPDGSRDGLNAYHFVYQFGPLKKHRGRYEILFQQDTSASRRFPENFFHEWSIDGAIKDFSYSATFALQRGQTADFGRGRLDNHGSLIYLSGKYNVGRISAGVAFGRGSGDKDPNDRKQGNFTNLFMDEIGFRYNGLFADDVHGFDGTVASLGRGSGFANVTFVQPFIAFRPAWRKGLILGSSFTFHRATRKRLEGSGVLGTLTPSSTRFTDDVGNELDLYAEYFYKQSIRPFIDFAVFFPRDIFGPRFTKAVKLEAGIEFKFGSLSDFVPRLGLR